MLPFHADNAFLHPIVEAFSGTFPKAGSFDVPGVPPVTPERPRIMEKLNLIAMAFNMAERPEGTRPPLDGIASGGPDTAYQALKKYVEGGGR